MNFTEKPKWQHKKNSYPNPAKDEIVELEKEIN